MRWKQSRRSTNVDDRRGRAVGGRGLRVGGGLGVVIVLVVVLLGGDPLPFISALLDGGGAVPAAPRQPSAAEDELAEFTAATLGMTEDVWTDVFQAAGGTYEPPTLVLFTDAVRSACGLNSAATGPFYCPPDKQVYIDLGFFRDLGRMAGVSPQEFDFAGAYVIAHEVGHHVQNLLGTSAAVRDAQRSSPESRNELSVLLELQADCYAGLWANRANAPGGGTVLEPGDVEEGLRTAAAIGDDRLQNNAGRAASPESFTHGSSEQRMRWFRAGLESGRLEACDTFSAAGYR
ncbi:MAG: neutral zinc metallopeptidase [Gemmatimonadota bacterium]|nr:neutral zinc metallopeptidase [Gemmatimonadota bacterium]MDH3427597.1 neutral zinc metallopeptidase [Gemmatimonadota bacterium]